MSTEKRPWHTDPRAVASAVEDIIGEVAAWAQQSPDEIRADLIRCAQDDAYQFARQLDDRAYWSVDAELVEILSGYSTYSARTKLVKEWVSANGITIDLKVGDIVTARGQPARVVDLRHDTAEVVVQPVENDGKNYGTTGGWVHAIESVEASNA